MRAKASAPSDEALGDTIVCATAEASRPFREFKERARSKRSRRGRKRKHAATDAVRHNWVHPLVFKQIIAVTNKLGPSMSPKEIVTNLRAANPTQFSRLTPQILGCWIERPKNGPARWKNNVLERVQTGNKPQGYVTRSGVLVRRVQSCCSVPISHELCCLQSLYPELVAAIIEYLQYLRAAGIPMDITTIRAVTIALITHHAPELLCATGPDKRPFLCTEAFVRKFIYNNLKWVSRASTRAAQKTPANAEQQIYELFLRLALWARDAGVHHPSLLINFDQTQVVMADNTANTFEVEGSKQVGVIGKEEKRAFTAVVGVSAPGDVLPTQFIFKGGSDRSLPSLKAPGRDEASRLGFLYS